MSQNQPFEQAPGAVVSPEISAENAAAEGDAAPSWTDGSGGRLGQARGALGLVRDGIDGVTCLVRDVHLAIARRPFEALSYAPVVSEGAAVVRPIYEGVAGAVYESVRLVNRLVCAGLEGALEAAEAQQRERSS